MSIQHRFERRIQTLCTCVCATVIAVHSIDSLASDEPSAPPPFVLQSVEETYSGEVAKAEAAISKAEADAVKARKAAAAVRLKAYKDRLVEVTKSGDFDKALAVKARVDQLEKEPDGEIEKPGNGNKPKRPRPKDTVKFAGHTYALIKEPSTWHVAKQRCEEMGGHLVCVSNARESEFVAMLCGKQLVSIGATDELDDKHLVNVDGSNPVFHMQLPNKMPLEHWVMWDGTRYLIWQAGGMAAYVCEWDR